MPRAPIQTDALGVAYASTMARERGMLRVVLSDGLGDFTGDPFAEMYYAARKFKTEVFLAYGVKLVGWPDDIEFTNPSNMKKPTAKVRALLDAWAAGTLRWVWATQDEYIAGSYDVRGACPGPHFPNPVARAQRNDVGKCRARAADAEADKYPRRYVHDDPKSFRNISDEMNRGLWPVTTWADIGMQLIRGQEADDDGVVDSAREESPALPPRRL